MVPAHFVYIYFLHYSAGRQLGPAEVYSIDLIGQFVVRLLLRVGVRNDWTRWDIFSAISDVPVTPAAVESITAVARIKILYDSQPLCGVVGYRLLSRFFLDRKSVV